MDQMKDTQLPCSVATCRRWFKNQSGLTQHMRRIHQSYFAPSPLDELDESDEDVYDSDESEWNGSSTTSETDLDDSDDVNQPQNNWDTSWSPHSSPPPPPLPDSPQSYAQSSQAFHSRSRHGSSSLRSQPQLSSSPQAQKIPEPAPKCRSKISHPKINGLPCDEHGQFLPPDTPPPPCHPDKSPEDWAPFQNQTSFETAELLYCRTKMSATNIDTLMDLWTASLAKHGESGPFINHSDLYGTIDSIPLSDVPWDHFSLSYGGEIPDVDAPQWMTDSHEVWYRDPRAVVHEMLQNPDFNDGVDYAPFREFDETGEREYRNFMSGDWAWEQADKIAEERSTHGSMFVPIIIGSDKTTVSVATGQNDFYPLYISTGVVHNNIRRAHGSALMLIGFLAMPKTDKEHTKDAKFKKFRRQLFHSSLSKIFETLKPGMTVPEVVRCSDGHFRRAIYGIGPYIADYPEQVLLANVVQGWCPKCDAKPNDLDGEGSGRRSREHSLYLNKELEYGEMWDDYGLVGELSPFTNDFPRADIHELIAPDLLHQLIKGTFKDHLVTWVGKYLHQTHGEAGANRIQDDIDRRIAAAAPFSGLRRFPQGRGFKQWTGDDSKALMKVYLPAIEGYVPQDMLRTFRAFLEFCYIARRNVITEKTLDDLQDALRRFHHYRVIFHELGIRPEGLSLPRQHSLVHYFAVIRSFGAPNGHCSSITESKHIRAVKEPWRRSNRHEPLGQMLLTNQRLDKLAAARSDFTKRGMLDKTALIAKLEEIEQARHLAFPEDGIAIISDFTKDTENGGIDAAVDEPIVLAKVKLAKTIKKKLEPSNLAEKIKQPRLPELMRRFLYDQLYPNTHLTSSQVSLDACPHLTGKVSIFSSAAAVYYAPSDPCGINGMHREHIRSVTSWRNGPARYDTVFINTDPNSEGMLGLDVARILLFFSFTFDNIVYPCALVHWFYLLDNERDEDTGMWIVKPEMNGDLPALSVVHLDCIFRAAHLLPIFGTDTILKSIAFHNSLDSFISFYVNKFIDHHAFEIA